MFRQAAAGVRFRPENGQRVRLFGSVGLYAKTGSYQFYTDAMEPDGVGDLYLRFEVLKRKLVGEGLFDEALKKPLPLLPRGIGIVTSDKGAVVHDIARVAWRRFPAMPLYLFPVRVQGDGAAAEIAAALGALDRLTQVEVIIVGRGGGSMEDLWPFNEECVARAIAACQTPVVSAVGHETDFTIADFVADLRAPTPSAAAELAVPRRDELLASVDALTDSMEYALLHALAQRRLRLNALEARLSAQSPARRGERMSAALRATAARMQTALESALTKKRHAVEHTRLRIAASSPMETLKRGYAVVLKKGKAVRSVQGVQAGDRLRVVLMDGTFDAQAMKE